MQTTQPTSRYGVKVTTVDHSQRLIEVVFKSGDVKRISLYNVPLAFRWPEVGEAWMVCQANGSWYLESPWQSQDTLLPIEVLESGELRLDGSTIRDNLGNYMVGTLDKPSPSKEFNVPAIMPGGKVAWTPIVGSLIPPGSLTGDLFALGSLGAGLFALNSITGQDIANATITSGNIQTGAITGSLIAINTITGDNIADATITSGNITTGSITGSLIAIDTITGGPSGNIAQATIDGGNITTGAITGNLIAQNTIAGGPGGNIDVATIDTGNIQTGAVTGDVIAINTITGTNIQNATITGGNIATGTVSGNNIAVNTITGSNIATNTITGSLIAANTIVAGLLAAGAVVAGNIAAGAVVAGSVAANAISANNISVTSLGAINATLGTVSAGTITSSSISSTTITGGLIQTHASGARIVLNGSTDTLEVFNSSGSGIVALDPVHGVQLTTGSSAYNSVTWAQGSIGGNWSGGINSNVAGSTSFTGTYAYAANSVPSSTFKLGTALTLASTTSTSSASDYIEGQFYNAASGSPYLTQRLLDARGFSDWWVSLRNSNNGSMDRFVMDYGVVSISITGSPSVQGISFSLARSFPSNNFMTIAVPMGASADFGAITYSGCFASSTSSATIFLTSITTQTITVGYVAFGR